MLWQIASLLGTAVRFGTGLVGKYIEEPQKLQVLSHLPHLRLLSRLWVQEMRQRRQNPHSLQVMRQRLIKGQPTRISVHPNALRATLNIQEIEQTTRFSEAEVLIWSEPRLLARRNAMIRIRLTLVGGDALQSNIP